MSLKNSLLAVFVLFGAALLSVGCVSDAVTPVEDEAPVLPPTNVSATLSGTSKVVIEWNPNSHPQLRGYNVYRVESATLASTKLTATPTANTFYNDPSARRGIDYQYRVTAVTKNGKESAYASVSVMLRADDRQNPDREF